MPLKYAETSSNLAFSIQYSLSWFASLMDTISGKSIEMVVSSSAGEVAMAKVFVDNSLQGLYGSRESCDHALARIRWELSRVGTNLSEQH